MTNEEQLKILRRFRGVDSPCEACMGMGRRMYSSGSTWRGGMGTAACTWDVCDVCWGSGDKNRIGANLREIEKERRDWEHEQCLTWLTRHLGLDFNALNRRLGDISDFCKKQANKRKIPQGEDYFWWSENWLALSSLFRKLIKEKE